MFSFGGGGRGSEGTGVGDQACWMGLFEVFPFFGWGCEGKGARVGMGAGVGGGVVGVQFEGKVDGVGSSSFPFFLLQAVGEGRRITAGQRRL